MIKELKLKKGTFQHVESEFYAYQDTQKEIVRLRNEILHGKYREDENIGGGRSNLPDDPTGRAVLLLTSHKKLEQLQNIVDAIETVVERLPIEKRELIKLRYWTRSQPLTWDGTADHLHVSRRQALRWRDEIVNAVAETLGWR
ncbi:phage transcriptional activator, RinA family [Paenibacillus algorifonticola]|uniref:Phage transcriptional activator, RinA family n=1 Tax=Paenibacillus algorifonticola TaxID=684063 RepID=A0A1I2D189_9BACL|nr:RinA family phage transcriptional regulator [Paenibacillus algorifonticola]SFE74255.1 phage transcriptional activator, RinA family [Paenibacillus algorifonticola]